MAGPIVVPLDRSFPLFITDPKDDVSKHVGMLLVYVDGSRCWLRKIGNAHVMRSGRLGLDATTYDTHFAGHRGTIRVQQGPRSHEVPFERFEAHRTEKDYGHGRQYFLAFGYWTTKGPPPKEPPKPVEPVFVAPPTKVDFNTHEPCRHCKATGFEPRTKKPCIDCRGAKFKEIARGE